MRKAIVSAAGQLNCHRLTDDRPTLKREGLTRIFFEVEKEMGLGYCGGKKLL